jgi:hypothetical protein
MVVCSGVHVSLIHIPNGRRELPIHVVPRKVIYEVP